MIRDEIRETPWLEGEPLTRAFALDVLGGPDVPLREPGLLITGDPLLVHLGRSRTKER